MSTQKVVIWHDIIEHLLGSNHQEMVMKLSMDEWYIEKPDKGLGFIRQRYHNHLRANERRPAISTSCPGITRIIMENFPHLLFNIVPVKPLLIKSMLMSFDELKKRLQNDVFDYAVVAPCKEFLYIEERFFSCAQHNLLTWKEFKKQHKIKYPNEISENFVLRPELKQNNAAILVLSGLDTPEKLNKAIDENSQDFDLLDLYFCEGGCLGSHEI